MSLGVAIVGCGLIGQKRAKALAGSRLVACADVMLARAESLARTTSGAVATADWRAAVDRPDVDLVVVATTNSGSPQLPKPPLMRASTSSSRSQPHALLQKLIR